jgi:hypothetical protein
MYNLTGLPGWMRFGFSPGWVGRSPTGMGPCASFLMTGQWPTPQAQAYWQTGQAPWPAWGPGVAAPPGAPGMTREQELSMLKQQADWLKAQLDEIGARVSELETEGDR